MLLLKRQITSIEEDWNGRKPNQHFACICDPILFGTNSYLQKQYDIDKKLSKLWGESGSLTAGETYLIDNIYCLALPRLSDPRLYRKYIRTAVEDLRVQMRMLLHNHIIIYVESCYPECRYNHLFIDYLGNAITKVFKDDEVTVEICWEQ